MQQKSQEQDGLAEEPHDLAVQGICGFSMTEFSLELLLPSRIHPWLRFMHDFQLPSSSQSGVPG